MGAAFQIRKGEKEFLGPRRGAGLWPPGGGAKSPEGDGPYAYPAGGYFSIMSCGCLSLLIRNALPLK